MEWNKNVLAIEEVYTESKTGSREKNEDAVYYNADFIAVIYTRMPCIIMRISLP